MISKKIVSRDLIREVLDDESIDFVDFELRVGEKVGYFSNRDRKKKYIDIHRLSNKCKEWAYREGYIVKSLVGMFAVANINGIHENYVAPTEPEAIFLAAQWVLDNKDK